PTLRPTSTPTPRPTATPTLRPTSTPTPRPGATATPTVSCNCSNWARAACGGWCAGVGGTGCAADERCWQRTCTPAGCDFEFECRPDGACSAPTSTPTPRPGATSTPTPRPGATATPTPAVVCDQAKPRDPPQSWCQTPDACFRWAWDPVPESTIYRVQVYDENWDLAEDTTWRSPDWFGWDGSQFFHISCGLQPGRNYHSQIGAWGDCGAASWSDYVHVSIVCATPTSGPGVTPTPTLPECVQIPRPRDPPSSWCDPDNHSVCHHWAWEPVAGATQYRVEVYDDSWFRIVNTGWRNAGWFGWDGTELYYNTCDLVSGEVYHSHVGARGPCTLERWSDFINLSYTCACPVPSVPANPIPVSPPELSCVSGKVRVSWNAVSGADRYEVRTQEIGGSWVYYPRTINTWLEVDVVDGKSYRWAVRAISDSCGAGLWATQNISCCNATLPEVPILISPANNTQLGSLAVTFIWNEVADWGESCAGCSPYYTLYLEDQAVYLGHGDGGVLTPLSGCENLSPETVCSGGRCQCTHDFGESDDRIQFVWQIEANNCNLGSRSPVWTYEIKLNPNPWFQTQSGDVHAGGVIDSDIPITSVPPALFSLAEAAPALPVGDEGVVSCGGASADFGTGDVSDRRWLAADGLANLYDYAYFYDKLDSPTVDNLGNGSMPISLPAPPNNTPTVYYSADDLSLTGGNVSEDQSLMLLIDGDLTIDGNIEVAPGGFFGVFTSGGIDIRGNVSRIEGIYFAGGPGSVFDTCSTPPCGEDEATVQLVAEGVYIASNFDLGRSLPDNDYPAELFSFRPDLVINAPVFIWRTPQTWQELAP
ncbi:MAG: hypothetical protein JW991_02200, partial [Candidatus Pacebacteria bacterium]|nr:hypothetical protein [Candidatus Paceibacterota bacterium]